jgi:trk system potassium uptake protein
MKPNKYTPAVKCSNLLHQILSFLPLTTALSISSHFASLRIRPLQAFVLSFVILIIAGTLLLMLPTMTTPTGSMPPLEALFTAVSASCVTGLVVVDTATYFTLRGQWVILFLIQTGGLLILFFTAFFASSLSTDSGMQRQQPVPMYFDNDTLAASRSLLRQIVFIIFFIEGGTFVLLFFTWGIPFDSLSKKLFFSAFHAISAFCNAGFSLFSHGLYEEVVRTNYILHMVIAIAVILGAFGVSATQDIFSPQRLRDRLEHPRKNWLLSTRVAFNVSAVLLIIGTGLFFLWEQHRSLSDKNLSEVMISSFFQSAAMRTAGFSTVDISQLADPSLILMMILMFIGGASTSTAGGIKVSTLYIILRSVCTSGSRRLSPPDRERSERSVSPSIVSKALYLFFASLAVNVLGFLVLGFTEESVSMTELLFEQVSAFSTTGLSTGITAGLSSAGKAIIIVSMLLGRVGILCFVVALSIVVKPKSYQLPASKLMVG